MANQENIYQAGLDIGSTTAKIVVMKQDGTIIYSNYQRHNAKVYEAIESFIHGVMKEIGNCSINLQLTGSAGLGISEKTGIPFIQEVIATDGVIRKFYPKVKTLIDIGGEDSKMIFFNQDKLPDIRMNGNCAGGTGSFIDQIATLLNVTPTDLNELAANHTTIYPIASRCGVFAKTDVQNLISRKIPKEDISASIFHAVAIQCMNTLARGFDILPKVMLCGGPFTFLPELSKIFAKAIKLDKEDIITPDKPELLPAIGAALIDNKNSFNLKLDGLADKLSTAAGEASTASHRLEPLFIDQTEYTQWREKHAVISIEKKTIKDYQGEICFLGIDSGSTTTKITVTGENNELLFSWYQNNRGNPVNTVIKGLEEFKNEIQTFNPNLTIAKSTVTGYGEDLIKAAFGIDKGVVETIAHYTAAKHLNPDVSFVLDIGGQDMKAIFINEGIINRIELNEACSSGCGSFIETFSNSLDYDVANFAEKACQAEAPCDLGTRCTVFMNSKVKQSLRENATVDEISAGLSYSVIKNCLFKVLKLTNMQELGDNIVVQGGTFKNPSIVRAMEILSEKDVRCSDIPELMGAYGASLISHLDYLTDKSITHSFVGLENLSSVENYKTKQILCKGCENNCIISRFTFTNKKSFISGNKCEKIFTNKGEKNEPGFNLFEYKQQLLFNQEQPIIENPTLTIGVPKSLGIFENFPFWNTLFTACGINVITSSSSTMKLYEKGLGAVMSDSICFPAKLAHGHIIDLIEQKADRIFYPIVIYENKEFNDSVNSFNCPIVSSYSEVIQSAMSPKKKWGVPFDKPVITFSDTSLLKKSCTAYLKQFGISKRVINRAVDKAILAQRAFKNQLKSKAAELIYKAKNSNRLLIVLAGRPYHTDSLINHKTPEILASLGVDVVTEDSVPLAENEVFEDIHVLTQWSYPNRIYKVADWTAKQPENIQFVQFNSFGCGPDALVADETRALLKTGGKNFTLIKVDEITSTGSVRLRLRSMIESLKLKKEKFVQQNQKRKKTPAFEVEDIHRTILAPHFADCYSPLIPPLFELDGYKVVNLPKPDKESVQFGLRYSNNDICYPATIVIGDIIKALKKGDYNHKEIAIGITQTGGQCRASSYISLIRKAMLSAGYDDIPVISVTLAEGLNDQPGFKVNWLKHSRILLMGTIYADCLAKMLYATVVREVNKGESQKLHEKYLNLAQRHIVTKDYKGLVNLIRQATDEFNNIDIKPGDYPKIGVVGEIYVKYNSFGHQGIVDWLIEQGVEVVIPPIVDFFTQDYINIVVNRKAHLRKSSYADLIVKALEIYTFKFQDKINRIMADFRFHTPFHDLKDVAGKASRILDLANQFGEGWLIPAEIAAFADDGINNVVSLQPFGCIANHVISKGVETRIKEIYPDMNLLFLDFEAGTSEVNVLNRLYFMLKNVTQKSPIVA